MSTRTEDVVLYIRDLRVDYGVGDDAVHAVRGVDLALRRGEVLGVAGESGSGKSTLAYAITRLLRRPGVITGGEVRYYPGRGRAPFDVLAVGPEELRRFRWEEVAVVFQAAMSALNPVLDVRAQLTDTLRAHRPGMSRAARRERAAELLEMVGIDADRLSAFPHQLSGGQRQRVMIAMALALEPEVIILDEPTTSLDVVVQRNILRQIMELRERLDCAVIFITHDLSLLLETADRIAVMYAGRVVETASAASLVRAPQHPYTTGLLSSFPVLNGPRRPLVGVEGSPPDLRTVTPGCPFRPRCPEATSDCAQTLPELVEVAGRAHLVACLRRHPASVVSAARNPDEAEGTA
jgi:peptide/nickel transport system ATP-binding protein